MKLPMKVMTDYIISIGADKIPHTNKTYLAHAIGVYRDMKSWEEHDEMCRAAMFHSIYGTEGFQTFCLPLERRDEIRRLIGDRAERIAYANCAMDRASFYSQVDTQQDIYQLKDRITGRIIELSHMDFEDLIRLHLCDYLEQVERVEGWGYHRETLKTMGERLGGAALAAYKATFSREPRLV